MSKLQPKLFFSTIVTTRVILSSYKSFRENICRFFPVYWKQFSNTRRQIVRFDRNIFNNQRNISSRFAWFDKCLRDLISRFGVPEEISSDGGPQFLSSSTKEFLKTWGVAHRVASAYYPRSNRRAELAVK